MINAPVGLKYIFHDHIYYIYILRGYPRVFSPRTCVSLKERRIIILNPYIHDRAIVRREQKYLAPPPRNSIRAEEKCLERADICFVAADGIRSIPLMQYDVKKAICIRGLKRRKKTRRYGHVYSFVLPLLDICKVYK